MDVSKLEAFAKALKLKHKVRIGVFSDDAMRAMVEHRENRKGKIVARKTKQVSDVGNPEIAAIHELGKGSNPPRSFLRVPIMENGKEIVKEASKNLVQFAISGQIMKFWRQLGIAAEKIVLKAFDTEGFGQWAALKAGTIRAKGSSKPLIDSGQLRRAITSVVV